MQTGYSDNIKPQAKVEENNSKLEQELNNDIQPIDTTSSPDCINTPVVCVSLGNLNNAELSNDDSANEYCRIPTLYEIQLAQYKRSVILTNVALILAFLSLAANLLLLML